MTTRERIEEVLLRTFRHDLENDISEREAGVVADALERAGLTITPQAGEAFGYVYQKDHGNGIAELFFKKHKLTDFAGWEEIPLYCTAPPRPVAQHPNDTAVELSAALEQQRALHIVAAVKAVSIGGAEAEMPTPFHAGYQLACEEIEHRLRTEQWELCGTPTPLPPVQPSPVAPVWQPIETAPRDGTRVDIWYDGERYTDCVWLPVRHCFVFDDSDGMRQRIDGTHWMPLPEPPSPPDSPGAGKP